MPVLKYGPIVTRCFGFIIAKYLVASFWICDKVRPDILRRPFNPYLELGEVDMSFPDEEGPRNAWRHHTISMFNVL